METILNCAQAAAWLRCSESTIRKMAEQEQIPFIRCGRKLLFIAAELEDWFFCKVDADAQENHGNEPGLI